jgi:hypothetical protein
MNKKIFLFWVVLLITGQLFAAQESKLITLTADGSETAYALTNVQKIVFEDNTMTVNMKSGDDVTGVTRISFLLEGLDYSNLKINEVSGVGDTDCDKFYELINMGDVDIPLEGCKIYYNANGTVGESFPPIDERLTWTGNASQTAKAGKLFSLIGRNGGNCSDPPTPNSFALGITPERILIITLKDPAGNIIDRCVRAEDTGQYAVGRDFSFSRVPDGTGPFYFTYPTPDQLNGNDAKGLLLVPQNGLGIKYPKAESTIFVFPNPVQTYLTVSGVDKDVKINLLDMNGMILKSIPAQDKTTDIDVSALQQGTYLLQMGNQVVKFIKQ